MGKRIDAHTELSRRLCKGDIKIALIQEPTNDGKFPKKITGGELIYIKVKDKLTRAAIWINNKTFSEAKPMVISQFSSADIITVLVKLKDSNGDVIKDCILTSYYSPSLVDGKVNKDPLSKEFINLINHCKKNDLNFIIGGDFNSKHCTWNDNDFSDDRGNILFDFLNDNDIDLLNQGKIHTYEEGTYGSTIDLTLSDKNLSRKIQRWEVDRNFNGSDHNSILFNLSSTSFLEKQIRLKKRTNWILFKKILNENCKFINHDIDSIETLEKSSYELTNLLRKTYKKCSRFRKVKSNFKLCWYDNILNEERKNVKKAYLIRLLSLENNINYKKSRDKYRYNCRIRKKFEWRKFTSNIDSIKETARMQKIFEKKQHRTLGSLLKTDGSYTENHSESLHELMKKHFPDCEKIDKNIQLDNLNEENFHQEPLQQLNETEFERIKKFITPEMVKWSIDSFSPYKAPGEDSIFPALMQKSLEFTSEIYTNLFIASIKFSYIPKTWRKTLVTFIPKPNKGRYDTCSSYRPISLMSFQLKALERIVNSYLNEFNLKESPIDPSQHAYTKGKSTESAIHSLVTELERSQKRKARFLVLFIDISGAFDNTRFTDISKALYNKKTDNLISNWINEMLSKREIRPTEDEDGDFYSPSAGCPQGGILAPELWKLVIDELIIKLREKGFVVSYADDLALKIENSIDKNLLISSMEEALIMIENWCISKGLSVSPDKASLLYFTNEKDKTMKDFEIFNNKIKIQNEVKYLGIFIDKNLNWSKQANYTIEKGLNTLFCTKNLLGKTWGLNPKMTLWIFNQIVLPRMLFGSIAWWHIFDRGKNKVLLDRLNGVIRRALLYVTGAPKTTPTKALMSLFCVEPFDILIKSHAYKTAFRLKNQGNWNSFGEIIKHRKIFDSLKFIENSDSNNSEFVAYVDSIKERFIQPPSINIIINEKENWKYKVNLNEQTWFIDAAVKDSKSGFGIICKKMNIQKSIRIMDGSNVFITEAMALKETCDLIRDIYNDKKNITILTDNKNFIQSLTKHRVSSKALANCIDSLDYLSKLHNICIAWIPKNAKHPDHTLSDTAAKQSLTLTSIDEKLSNNFDINIKLKQWSCNQSIIKWNKDNETNDHHSESFKNIIPYNQDTANRLVNESRKNLRTLICMLTGHGPNKKFLFLFNKISDDRCRFCNLQSETNRHLLCECKSFQFERNVIFGKPEFENIRELNHKKIIRFCNITEVGNLLNSFDKIIQTTQD